MESLEFARFLRDNLEARRLRVGHGFTFRGPMHRIVDGCSSRLWVQPRMVGRQVVCWHGSPHCKTHNSNATVIAIVPTVTPSPHRMHFSTVRPFSTNLVWPLNVDRLRFDGAWGGFLMILASIAAAALVVSVATGPAFERNGSIINLSAREKNAAVQPLV